MLQYTLRGYILGSGAPGTPVVMRQLQVHFVTITVESFKLVMEESSDFFKIRIPDPVRFLVLKVRIFPDPNFRAFKVHFLGIFWTFLDIFWAFFPTYDHVYPIKIKGSFVVYLAYSI